MGSHCLPPANDAETAVAKISTANGPLKYCFTIQRQLQHETFKYNCNRSGKKASNKTC
jgi:hypothetical protein